MISWQATALIFPGQGSQEVGMGADLTVAFPGARAVFAQADEVLGFPLSDLCFDGPAETLNDTLNTQPALFVMGVALTRVLSEALGDAFQPACAAGHSLGELTALTAAGAMTFADGLRLVRERGRLMHEASQRAPGAMAAVLGLDAEVLAALCAEASAQTGRPLVIANDNCPGQIVISGDKPTLELALPRIEGAGAKRVVPLAVSVASHSPLMESITADFARALAITPFSAPRLPVIGNVHAAPLESAEAIRAELGAQLTSTVRWAESVQAMRARGIEVFVELGPKDVLSGLVKRIDRAAQRHTLNSAEAVQAFLSECGAPS
ncbi:MAG: ACP S-malonyltransferase [Anaerolineae bacterium]|nr:ACP S-malonyltransferase [Anaerolineae bacterium]